MVKDNEATKEWMKRLREERKIAGKRARNRMREVREAFFIAFEEVGGIQFLKLFAKHNPKDFASLVAHLCPRAVDMTGKMEHEGKVEFAFCGSASRLNTGEGNEESGVEEVEEVEENERSSLNDPTIVSPELPSEDCFMMRKSSAVSESGEVEDA